MKNLSITTTRYNEPNSLFHATISSLGMQKNIKGEILVLDQKYNQETKELCEKLTTNDLNFNYIIIEAKGLSYARNYAINISQNEILLYIDSDAIANENWAYELSKTFIESESVYIVGGKIIPKWHKKPPFLVKADYIYDVYSMFDLGDGVIETKKIVGANFGLHKGRIGKEVYFDENLGRKPGKLLGGEESDLCQRVKNIGGKIYYNGQAVVQHQVLPERLRISWILKRMYWGGYNRGLAGGMPKTNNTKEKNIWNYLLIPFVIPFYGYGLLKGKNDKLSLEKK